MARRHAYFSFLRIYNVKRQFRGDRLVWRGHNARTSCRVMYVSPGTVQNNNNNNNCQGVILLLSIYLTGIPILIYRSECHARYTHTHTRTDEQPVTRDMDFRRFYFEYSLSPYIHLVSSILPNTSVTILRTQEQRPFCTRSPFGSTTTQFRYFALNWCAVGAQVFYREYVPVCTHRNPTNPHFARFANEYTFPFEIENWFFTNRSTVDLIRVLMNL